MHSTRICCLLLVLAVVTVAGCRTPRSAYVPEHEQGITTTGVDPYDYQLVVEKMVGSMLRTDLVTQDGAKPVIAFSPIRNETPYRVDVRRIHEKVRREVMQSGKALFSAATDPARSGGESGQFYKQHAFRNESGLVDPATIEKGPRIVAADYELYGRVASIQRRAGKVTEANYLFTLTLTDLRRGLVVWTEEKEIRKNIR